MSHRIFGIFILIITLTSCAPLKQEISTEKTQPPLDVLQFADTLNHTFVLGNKISGFFVGQSREQNTSSYQGWTVNENHLVRDYQILVQGEAIERRQTVQFKLFPYGFERHYANGVLEKFLFLDSLDIMIIQVSNIYNCALQIDTGTESFRVDLENSSEIKKTEEGQLEVQFRNPEQQVNEFWFGWNGAMQSAVLAGQTFDQLRRNAHLNIKPAQAEYAKADLNNAARWSRFALNNLITHQRGAGIWAGLPWFNNYWGRDTFISFSGALLVSGKFKQAKNILTNFAGFQLQDSSHMHYGRIPNRITNKEVIYNTADGTWWFIRELYEYYLYTADLELVRTLYPIVQTAIEGALQKRCDQYYFLTHADAETWMDAKGPDGAWSPRDNRAVEIQALWYTALSAAAEMAEFCGQESGKTEEWMQVALQLKQNFNNFFWNAATSSLYDHLNEDDLPDKQMRPNQIFALTVPDLPGIGPLLDEKRQRQVAQQVVQNLTRSEGVMSLAADDPNFHPFHHYQPYYVPDAAYHNGLIWTWLAGPVVSALAKFEQNEQMMVMLNNEAQQIMQWDAVGSYSELLEPVLRPGASHLKISGTVSQAWNLAEFQRNLVQDMIGYRPVAGKNAIMLKPRLQKGFGSLKARLPFKQNFMEINLIEKKNKIELTIESPFKETIKGLIHFSQSAPKIPFELSVKKPIFTTTQHRPDPEKNRKIWPFAENLGGTNFKVLADPGYAILEAQQVVYNLSPADQTVVSAADMLFDDSGHNQKYVYPQNPVFKQGIADIASIKIQETNEAWGFVINMRNLTDPGWHPEYGFQLTFLALAIATEDSTEKSTQVIGRSSNYMLAGDRSFERLIFVGGGVEIQNASGKRLAQFIPLQSAHALGFVDQRQIRFKIPKAYLTGFSGQSKVTILSGIQDDHGGAGIGAFRAVRRQVGEWHGGGAENDTDAMAVYDILEIN